MTDKHTSSVLKGSAIRLRGERREERREERERKKEDREGEKKGGKIQRDG